MCKQCGCGVTDKKDSRYGKGAPKDKTVIANKKAIAKKKKK